MSTAGLAAERRARRGLLAALVALVALLALVAAPAPAQEAGEGDGTTEPSSGATGGDTGSIDVDALRHEYEELVGDEADLLVEYDVSTARIEQLYTESAAAADAKEQADLALVDAQASLEQRRDEEAQADEDLAAAIEDVADAEQRVRDFAVGAFIRDGATDELATALQALEGEDESLLRVEYERSVDERQRRVIDALLDARAERTRLQSAARTATRRAQDQRDAVDELQAAAAAALEEKTRLTREASEERDRQAELILDIQSRRVAMEARIVSLDKDADSVQEALAGFQASDPDWVPGAVHFQSPAPCHDIGSEFGMRHHPILNITRLHAGGDIGVPTGFPVEAAADGIVLIAGARGGYGNTVVIAHGHSLGTVYAHNSELRVQPGQQVKRGDVIALAGSTGLSTGPHIHFETRLKGVPVNPRNFLLPIEGGTGMPGPPPPGADVERPDLSTTTTTTEPIGTC